MNAVCKRKNVDTSFIRTQFQKIEHHEDSPLKLASKYCQKGPCEQIATQICNYSKHPPNTS
jgi:hypothetical protein